MSVYSLQRLGAAEAVSWQRFHWMVCHCLPSIVCPCCILLKCFASIKEAAHYLVFGMTRPDFEVRTTNLLVSCVAQLSFHKHSCTWRRCYQYHEGPNNRFDKDVDRVVWFAGKEDKIGLPATQATLRSRCAMNCPQARKRMRVFRQLSFIACKP